MGHLHGQFSCYLSAMLADVLKAKYPEKYSVDKKPLEINLYKNGPRSQHSGQFGQNVAALSQSQAFPQMNFPFGYYPSPYMMPPPWYGQSLAPALNPTPFAPDPAPSAPKQAISMEYPKISPWLAYCDKHPTRSGENFSAHAQRFSDEGYRRIHQLTSRRISVEKLSDWLGIGKGTADLLIQYAEEDTELVKAGTFTME